MNVGLSKLSYGYVKVIEHFNFFNTSSIKIINQLDFTISIMYVISNILQFYLCYKSYNH